MAFNFNYPDRRGHPFWDFVASMDDMTDRRPPSYAPRDRTEREQTSPAQAQENETYKAPTVEDEKMADADAGPAKRDASGKEKDKARDEGSDSSTSSSSDDGQCCERRRCRRRCGKGRHGGPPPFGPWAFPGFLGPEAPRDMPEWGPPHPRHMHHHGPPGAQGHHGGRRHGPPGEQGNHRGRHHGPPPPGPPPPQGAHPGEHPPPPPHTEFGPHRHGGRRHGHGGPSGGRGGPFGGRGGPFGGRGGPFGRRGPGPNFDVPAFLGQLGGRLGVDLNAAAANFGVDLSRFGAAGHSDADFVPHHDLFDLTDEYLIHVSLPGAQREDIGLDFDGEHQTLRVGGVVCRPGIDENLSSAISHSGRNSEVGVFETKIRLPSQGNDLIEIGQEAISAKLRDGILVVHVPKINKKKEDLKRSVRIDTPSPEREPRTSNLAVREKEASRNDPFASDHKDKEKTLSPHPDGDLYRSTPGTEKGDHEKTGADATMDDQADPPEQLPEYTPSHPEYDEDDDDDDQEGEYVKIDVK